MSPDAVTTPMRSLDERSVGVLAAGMLSSMVLLASASSPPCVSVSDLWYLDADSSVTVAGLLVSLRHYESGTESIVLSDECGDPAVRVMCTPGPGPPPSASVSFGDLLLISGVCAFSNGTPTVFCEYAGVSVLREAEDVMTVSLLSTTWPLLMGDTITVKGILEKDLAGLTWLRDPESDCRIQTVLIGDIPPWFGAVVVEGKLLLDEGTMSFMLEARSVTPDV